MSTDTYRFDVIWAGSHYWLGSLSDHLRAKVDEKSYLLLDRLYRARVVPRSEVTFALRPISLPRQSVS